MIWKRQIPSAFPWGSRPTGYFFWRDCLGIEWSSVCQTDTSWPRELQPVLRVCRRIQNSKAVSIVFIKAMKGDFWLALKKLWQVSESSGKDSGQSVLKKTKGKMAQPPIYQSVCIPAFFHLRNRSQKNAAARITKIERWTPKTQPQ